MGVLSKRLARLETKAPDPDREIRVVFITFCDRGPDGELQSSLGLARLLREGQSINRGDDEPEGAFLQRAYAIMADAHPGGTMSREDREIAAAAQCEDVALAKFRGDPVTEAMMTSALGQNEGTQA